MDNYLSSLCGVQILILIYLFETKGVRVAEEEAINIICSNDHDTSYNNLLSGVIKTHNMTSDRDCTMMLALNGSVTIDIFVDELSMSSNDCDEEYFYIVDDLGKKIVNTTLCYTASAGDVVQTQVVKPTPGEPHHVTFRLRLEKDSDLPLTQRSLISLHFIVQPLGEHSIENLQLSGDKGLETSSVTKSNAESTPAAIQTIALSDSPSGKVTPSDKVKRKRRKNQKRRQSGLSDGAEYSNYDSEETRDYFINVKLLAFSLGGTAAIMLIIILATCLCVIKSKRKRQRSVSVSSSLRAHSRLRQCNSAPYTNAVSLTPYNSTVAHTVITNSRITGCQRHPPLNQSKSDSYNHLHESTRRPSVCEASPNYVYYTDIDRPPTRQAAIRARCSSAPALPARDLPLPRQSLGQIPERRCCSRSNGSYYHTVEPPSYRRRSKQSIDSGVDADYADIAVTPTPHEHEAHPRGSVTKLGSTVLSHDQSQSTVDDDGCDTQGYVVVLPSTPQKDFPYQGYAVDNPCYDSDAIAQEETYLQPIQTKTQPNRTVMVNNRQIS